VNERDFWITIRRALLMVAGAIEKKHGLTATSKEA
jgi:hypothetical protein